MVKFLGEGIAMNSIDKFNKQYLSTNTEELNTPVYSSEEIGE